MRPIAVGIPASVTVALLAFVIVLVASGPASGGGDTIASAQTSVDVAIDMDPTGNDARLSEGVDIQDCAVITGTGSIQFDVIVPPPGIAAADGLKGFQVDVKYNPAVVEVTGANTDFLIGAASGSSHFALSAPRPDSTDRFSPAATDLGTPAGPEPSGVSETGPGVLARITVKGVAPGISELTLPRVFTTALGVTVDALILSDVNAQPIPIGTITNARVVVDGTCPPPGSTPTPTPASGDCTGDGSTNIVDVLRLLRRTRDPGVAVSCGSGDCTGGGGDANIVDVLRLLRHIGDSTVALSC